METPMDPQTEFFFDPVEARAPAPSLAARLAARFRLWRRRRRWLAEMSEAAALGRLDDMLNDMSLTRAELGTLVDAPADAGTQFETFARLADVDLRELDPAVLREAIWKCTRCDCRTACKLWLRTGVWKHAGDQRCPNAELLRRH